jgi:amino acid adenylation domain-containing protein
VAFVAILKAGGAYVPFDPSYPQERFDFMLRDTGAPVMLTQTVLAGRVLRERILPSILVDEGDASSLPGDEANPAQIGGPTDLAYVMYTSGSTGRPKGVMVEHRAIVRLVQKTNFCHFGPDEVFLLFAPVSFDASTFEIWGPLLSGGRLVVMPPRMASLEDLGRVIRECGVTTLWLTAGLFHLMVEQRLEDLRPIRQLLAGGDVLSPRHVRMVLDRLPDCRVINGYGPTENTTFTCCHAMRAGDPVPQSIPIGRPISNTQVYILDTALRPVPPGASGELCAAGDGVARGYLNNPDATREKFLPDPYSAEPGARMYRTGDLARWRDDGVIEFLGRVDHQVKILGHRIEPGEVETVLRMHEGVTQVCVVPYSDRAENAKRLVAYYVASSNPGATPRELREFLTNKVPSYLIPAVFVPLASLPLSPNGKVDRAALPTPVSAPEGVGVTETPSTELERMLVDLWRRVLRAEHVGLDDNFFDLGGDSLLLVAVHSNLQKRLQADIAVTDLFEFTTIRMLARHLGETAPPSFSQVQAQAQKQRAAFARRCAGRAAGAA